MSRNGTIAAPFRTALLRRTAPATGVTLKMLAHQLRRMGCPISEDTIARYRDDATTITAAAIKALDAALAHFGFPGFMAEVYGCLPPGVGATRASSAYADGVVSVRAGGAVAETTDACWWATHEGTLHSAARGHADFARRYLDLPQDTEADTRRFAINHLGWLALTRFADGRLVLEGDATRNAAARERVAAWLESRVEVHAGLKVSGGALPHPMPAIEAAVFLRGLGHAEPRSAWSVERIGQNDLTDPAARDLWRAIHDAGIERAHMVEIAGRMGLLDRCSLFVVEGDDVISANVGSSLPVDRAVVGRNVLGRRDLDYARQLRAGILASLDGPTASRIRLNGSAGILGGYDRAAWAQRTGRHRWQVLSTSTALSIPSNFQTLG